MIARGPFFSWLRCALLALVPACAASSDSATPRAGSGASEAGSNAPEAGPVAREAGSGGGPTGADAAASFDATAEGADAVSLPGAPSCELQVGSCPARPSETWKVLLDAAAFGPGASLTALGGQAVLILDMDAAWRVVRVHDADEAMTSGEPYSVWTFPNGDLQGIDVAEGRLLDSSPRSVFAVACDQGRVRCTLLRGGPGETGLLEQQRAELPAGFEPRGLVFDGAMDPHTVCAYGNGLLCWDTAWQEAIAPAQGLQLNHVSVGEPWSLAVGSRGRYFKRERDGAGRLGDWIEQAPLSEFELTSASVAAAGGVIVGGGRVQAALGDQRASFGCGSPDNLEAFLVHPSVRDYAVAVTLAGEVIQHLPTAMPGEFCTQQRLPAGGIVETGTAPCRDGWNPRALTERMLVGVNLCPIGS